MSSLRPAARRLLPLLGALGLVAASGGPDAGDLVMAASDEAAGPPHVVLDLSGVDDLGLDGAALEAVDLPFAFQWYGGTVSAVTVSSDGIVYFDGAAVGGSGVCPGDGGSWSGVAALWSDLDAGVVRTTTLGRYPHRAFAVEWTAPHAGAADAAVVQVWLLEGDGDAVIVLDDVDLGDAAWDGGLGAVVGAQGGAATGLPWSCSGGLSSGASAWFGPQGARAGAASRETDDLADPYLGGDDNQYAARALALGEVDGDGWADLLVGNQDQDQAFLLWGGEGKAGVALHDADAVFTASSAGADLGSATLLADLDGDGLDEVLLGARSDSTAYAQAGAVVGVAGGAVVGEWTLPADADLTLWGPAGVKSEVGGALAAADVDGDGTDDLLVAGTGATGSAAATGAVWLWPGGSAVLAGSSSLSDAPAALLGSESSAKAGSALAAADLDGDGFAEVAVGAPLASSKLSLAGAAYLVAGPLSGGLDLETGAYAAIYGSAAGDQLGHALALGDADGDGSNDLLVGGPGDDSGATNAGAAWLFGSAGGLMGALAPSDADGAVLGDASSEALGSALGLVDLDGLGGLDLVVAAPNARGTLAGAGELRVFTTAPAGPATCTDAQHTLVGASASGALGTAFVGGADHDADGWPDLIAGAPYASEGGATNNGAVWVWSFLPDFLDEDGDGHVAWRAGGLDCADDDSDVWPGAAEVDGNLRDDDCDGWSDGLFLLRDDSDLWGWDLNEELGFAEPAVYDFEDAAPGDDVDALYLDAGLGFAAAGRVDAAAAVHGAAARDGLAARVTASDTENGLLIGFTDAVEAVGLYVIDADSELLLDISWSDGTTTSGVPLAVVAPDRSGGRFVGLTFHDSVESLTLWGELVDGFGIDDLNVVWASATDRDLDGWSDDDGDCDDSDTDVYPGAPEDLSNSIDDDCDGVVDAGDGAVYLSEAEWSSFLYFDQERIDFEDLADGLVVDDEYGDLGAWFDGALQATVDVDGAAPRDLRGAVFDGTLSRIDFDELQPAVGFYLLDAADTVTVTGLVDDLPIYTTTLDAEGDGLAGGVFFGLIYDYGVEALEIETDVPGDVIGLDDLIFHELGLDDADGDGLTEAEGDCDDSDASVHPEAEETWYDGVDADCDGASDYDADGDGSDAGTGSGTDCDDGDAAISPDAEETWYDGVDADCDEWSDYDSDRDGHEGVAYGGEDCDDSDSAVSPDAEEVYYDEVDDNCEAADDYDADGDGWSAGGSGALHGSTDCDDTDGTTWPGADETWYDGVDSDCAEDDDDDRDADGYPAETAGGTDCDDGDSQTHPDAEADACYDGIDRDCDGSDDYDCDGDGYRSDAHGGGDCDDSDDGVHPGAGEDDPRDGVDQDCDGSLEFDDDGDGYEGSEDGGDDCDDADPGRNPGAAEVWYDGVDQDCDGNDSDQDGDGADALAVGGDDCDDADAAVYVGAAEVWYDGTDSDCLGDDDYDQDGDSRQADLHGGDDCDDLDASISPSAGETWYDGVDSDCLGDDDYDQDGDGAVASDWGGDDCDDLDPSSFPGAVETAFDGVDQDCDGVDDVDVDGDGDWSATDCDDLDPTAHVGADDLCYDGVDQDCGGDSDYDCDRDGQDSAEWGGEDCDDDDEVVYAGAVDSWYDGVDQDCAGNDDYDQDGDGYRALVWGGADCDDSTAAQSPGNTTDGCGLGDEDCDGSEDEDCRPDTGGGADTGAATDGGGEPSDSGVGVDPNGDWVAPEGGGLRAVEGCGCASSPGGAGGAGGGALWGLVVGLGLLRRRRR